MYFLGIVYLKELNNFKSYERKQVSLNTGSKRAVDGGITTTMIKPNGFLRIKMNEVKLEAEWVLHHLVHSCRMKSSLLT